MLPFTRDQFVAIFVGYNESIWPFQVVAYLVGIFAIVILFRPVEAAGRLVSAILALFWIWTGIAYHWLFFSEVNKAAYLFGVLFLAQGVCLAVVGVLQDRLRFGFRQSLRQSIGIGFIGCSTGAYPVIGILTGHAHIELPMFGVTPCPVTIFTFGIFLLATKSIPRSLLIVPFVWSLIGGSAAVLLDVPQDWLLLVSGPISIPLIIFSERNELSARQTRIMPAPLRTSALLLAIGHLLFGPPPVKNGCRL
jgi:Family of unknown function (DUF6064)